MPLTKSTKVEIMCLYFTFLVCISYPFFIVTVSFGDNFSIDIGSKIALGAN